MSRSLPTLRRALKAASDLRSETPAAVVDEATRRRIAAARLLRETDRDRAGTSIAPPVRVGR